MHDDHFPTWPRRRLLALVGSLGATAVLGRHAVRAAPEEVELTEAMIREAEWISGLSFSDDDRKLMLEGTQELLADFARLRQVELDNAVPPALTFRTLAERAPAGSARGTARPTESAPPPRPDTEDDLAFLPLRELAALVRTRKVSSLELTQLYLARLERLDPLLHCVITRTPELALRQARRADEEIAAGRYRGALHGIPWGAKDLLAVPGYPTTWGAEPFERQERADEATVSARLAAAGAVLVAKLSVGALAWGDVWIRGTLTRNPWKPEQGSSGSSAGSAAATSAGLVGFAIGTETWGSIVSPCTRCGVTGLRPTFGRVSRHGAMALSWSMDKVGPIAREVEDCALVFDAIHGADGLDPTAEDRPFDWPLARDVRTLRVGYLSAPFDEDRASSIDDAEQRERVREQQAFDRRTLDVLRGLGFTLTPLELPSNVPVDALALILSAEAATAFDELTRSGKDDELARQVADAWPNVFRQAQLIPAVEYLRANRVRTLLMREMERRIAGIDVWVAPSFGGSNLLLTNLTGHPAVVLPNGFRAGDGTPTSITFNGRLYAETELLAVAAAYQQATSFHLRRPALETPAPSAG